MMGATDESRARNDHPTRGWLGLRLSVASSLLLLAGCQTELHSPESALNPAGPQAQRIASLTWLFMGVCAVVYVVMIVLLIGAFLHRRRGKAMEPGNDVLEPPQPGEKRLWTSVFSGIVITVLTLFVLLVADFATGRSIHRLGQAPEPLKIHVLAHQWWWEGIYTDWPDRFGERVASNTIRTAGDFHIPVDPDHPVVVELQLESNDVIHSFWAPNLHGKKDVVPGHPPSIWIAADRPGIYWGECAEYCGYQHAQMRFAVVAEPVEKFQAWIAAQRQPANEPTTEMQTRGRNVFLHSTCIMCHAIQGTDARAHLGPDLTHVASRTILAGGAIPNMPGHLAGWIVDPQRIKPGTQMPQSNLSPIDLRSLLEYLDTLK